MTDQSSDADHAADVTPRGVTRRLMLRGSALVTGAAAVTAIRTVTPGSRAHAADGEALVLGRTNDADSATTLAIDASSPESTAALILTNPAGPALQLTPLPDSWSEPLAAGQVASLPGGPMVGIDRGQGVQNAFVALDQDLDSLSLPVPIPPVRVLDTRTAAGRDNIASSSSDALDASGRLRAGYTLDIALASSDEATIDGVFANLTATAPLASGYLTVYPSSERPIASSLNFAKDQTIANASLFATGLAGGQWIIRVYASATTHLIIDVNGFTAPTRPGLVAAQRSRAARRYPDRRKDTVRAVIRALKAR